MVAKRRCGCTNDGGPMLIVWPHAPATAVAFCRPNSLGPETSFKGSEAEPSVIAGCDGWCEEVGAPTDPVRQRHRASRRAETPWGNAIASLEGGPECTIGQKSQRRGDRGRSLQPVRKLRSCDCETPGRGIADGSRSHALAKAGGEGRSRLPRDARQLAQSPLAPRLRMDGADRGCERRLRHGRDPTWSLSAKHPEMGAQCMNKDEAEKMVAHCSSSRQRSLPFIVKLFEQPCDLPGPTALDLDHHGRRQDIDEGTRVGSGERNASTEQIDILPNTIAPSERVIGKGYRRLHGSETGIACENELGALLYVQAVASLQSAAFIVHHQPATSGSHNIELGRFRPEPKRPVAAGFQADGGHRSRPHQGEHIGERISGSILDDHDSLFDDRAFPVQSTWRNVGV
jgi:hypothetical protein